MDTPSSVLGKRTRNTEEPLDIEPPETGKNGKHPRGDALATAVSAGTSSAQERAQWRNPGFKPQEEALLSPFVGSVDGATSAWVADGRNRVSGEELSPEAERTHGELVHEGSLMFTLDATRVMFQRRLR